MYYYIVYAIIYNYVHLYTIIFNYIQCTIIYKYTTIITCLLRESSNPGEDRFYLHIISFTTWWFKLFVLVPIYRYSHPLRH